MKEFLEGCFLLAVCYFACCGLYTQTFIELPSERGARRKFAIGAFKGLALLSGGLGVALIIVGLRSFVEQTPLP